MRKLLVLGVLAVGLTTVAANAAMSPVVSSKLSGRSEVPKKGDPNGSALAILHLDAKKGTACWEFKRVRGIAKPTAAHIHRGRRGRAGAVSVPLGAAYKAKGCQKASKATIAAIETHPNNFYVNIHNGPYPGGALRGQLVIGMTG